MEIVCISASNTPNMGENSTSTRVCELIKKIVISESPASVTEVIPLMNQRIKFCMLCGDCSEDGLCPYDNDFNNVYAKLKEADVCFFVVPHYTPIPSKLLAVFEKINEILYAQSIHIPQFQSPFLYKRAAVIGHGGSAESREVLQRYHDSLITPVANTLSSFGFSIVGFNEDFPLGAPFGLKDETCVQPSEGSVFPETIQSWKLIESRIRPLVLKAIK